MLKFFTTCSLLVFTLFFTACEIVEDQTNLSPAQQGLVNPSLSVADPIETNEKHQVLVAVIDSGVDYNHPWLIENIHYHLDEEGNPTGAGYDYLGEDTWPAPYLARTADKMENKQERLAQASTKNRQLLQNLVDENLGFLDFLNPDRQVEQELRSYSYHGTHVAGIIGKDDSRIGILPYRVMPISLLPGNKEENPTARMERAYDMLFQSIEQSILDGARVVNMSLSFGTQSGEKLENKSAFEQLKEEISKRLGHLAEPQPNATSFADKAEKMRQLILAHPEVVFVAAAGNFQTRVVTVGDVKQLPCGFSAPNLLCVGAVDKNNKRAVFSNVIMHGNLVFAPGVSVLSATPTGMCLSEDTARLYEVADNGDLDILKRIKKQVDACTAKEPVIALSGTSMAAPFVARLIANMLIENPALTGEAVIRRVLEVAMPADIAGRKTGIVDESTFEKLGYPYIQDSQ